MKYDKVYIPLVDYLLSRQVFIPDIKIRLYNNKGKISIRFVKNGEQFDFKISREKEGIYVYSINGDRTGPYKEGELFRLNPYGTKIANIDYGFSKAKLFKRLVFTLFSLFKHSINGRLDYGSRMLIKDFLKKLKKEPEDISRGGLLFNYKIVDASVIKLSCYDNGGIFDTMINGEGKQLTPRVMGAYYADAYSAYCFVRRFMETKNKKYLYASIRALEFVKRTYENYPKSIVWYHHDFKNPAYIEALSLLKKFINKTKYKDLYSLVPKMREDFYEPTNVFALRYHWRMARASLGFKENRQINICLRRLKNDQTKEGLIHDNNLEDYNDAHDLTYHQYSLACLAAGLEYLHDPNALEIFKKGCEFSYKMLTADGEISYNGRASNNIYHLAAAIYAFEKATNLFKEPRFHNTASKMLEYLVKWQKKRGYFPTAMNVYAKQRMAWNHCHTPYNALTCYFLYKANDNAKNSYNSSLNKPYGLNVMDDSGYASFFNKNYFFAFFSGCAKSYPWSEGCHQSGYAGTAILSINGLGAATLILDKDLKNNILSTDLPLIKVNNKLIEFTGRGKLSKINEHSFEYQKDEKDINLKRRYELNTNSIVIKTLISKKNDCAIDSPGLISIPLTTDNGWQVRLYNKKVIQEKGNVTVIYSLPLKFAELKKVPSNPRGRGIIVYFGSIKNYDLEKNIYYDYTITIKRKAY